MTRSFAAALLALPLSAGPCLAAEPAGDWVGVLTGSGGSQTRLALEVRPAAHGYSVTYEDLTHQFRGFPMKPTPADAPASYLLETPSGSLTVRWDVAAGQWQGVWRERSGDYRMSFSPGTIPPAPAITTPDKIVLGVTAGLIVVEGVAIARLLQLRRRRRLRVQAAAA
jgi:hypothetical protein